MLILSRVCAEFYDKHNNLLDRINPRDLGTFREIADAVKQDPLFQLLVDDGSIKYPADDAKDKALENDPFAGTTAEGKEIKPKAAARPKTKTKNNSESKIQNSELKSESGTEAAAESKVEEKPDDMKNK